MWQPFFLEYVKYKGSFQPLYLLKTNYPFDAQMLV